MEKQLVPGLNTFPPARAFHSAVQDQTNNRMIVFGGCADLYGDVPLNDAWVLSNAIGLGGAMAWTEPSPTESLPGARGYHNAVYRRDKITVFRAHNPGKSISRHPCFHVANKDQFRLDSFPRSGICFRAMGVSFASR